MYSVTQINIQSLLLKLNFEVFSLRFLGVIFGPGFGWSFSEKDNTAGGAGKCSLAG